MSKTVVKPARSSTVIFCKNEFQRPITNKIPTTTIQAEIIDFLQQKAKEDLYSLENLNKQTEQSHGQDQLDNFSFDIMQPQLQDKAFLLGLIGSIFFSMSEQEKFHALSSQKSKINQFLSVVRLSEEAAEEYKTKLKKIDVAIAQLKPKIKSSDIPNLELIRE